MSWTTFLVDVSNLRVLFMPFGVAREPGGAMLLLPTLIPSWLLKPNTRMPSPGTAPEVPEMVKRPDRG